MIDCIFYNMKNSAYICVPASETLVQVNTENNRIRIFNVFTYLMKKMEKVDRPEADKKNLIKFDFFMDPENQA
jgi:hypothetical protein